MMNNYFAITVDVEGDYWDEQSSDGVIKGIPIILNMLHQIEAKGTFFWTADMARRHPDILQAVVNQGHEIGCHGMYHENMIVLSEKQQRKVIREAVTIFDALGVACNGFRAPRLRINSSLFSILRDEGFLYDSSIPFWGLRRYKYGRRYDNPPITELKCVPSYAFRLGKGIFADAVRRSQKALGLCVFFLHPWEVIEQPKQVSRLCWEKKLNAINWIGTGPSFIDDLEKYFMAPPNRFHFLKCERLVDIV